MRPVSGAKPVIRGSDINEQHVAFIYQKAKERNDLAAREGRKPKRKWLMPGYTTLEIHEFGTAIEFVTAWALDRFPSGLFLPYSLDDDMGGIQIRGRTRNEYELYVFEDDPIGANWVLTCGTIHTYFRVHGFMHDDEVRQNKYWTPKHPRGGFPREDCWVIPTVDLSQQWNLLD